jgi:hypothetical protein
LDNVQWDSSYCASTKDGNEANCKVNGQLKLDELSNVIENSSSVFDGFIDRIKIVV